MNGDNFRLVTGPEAEASLDAWRGLTEMQNTVAVHEPIRLAGVDLVKAEGFDAIIQLCSKDRTDKQIGQIIGLSKMAVAHRRRRLGLSKANGRLTLTQGGGE